MQSRNLTQPCAQNNTGASASDCRDKGACSERVHACRATEGFSLPLPYGDAIDIAAAVCDMDIALFCAM